MFLLRLNTAKLMLYLNKTNIYVAIRADMYIMYVYKITIESSVQEKCRAIMITCESLIFKTYFQNYEFAYK